MAWIASTLGCVVGDECRPAKSCIHFYPAVLRDWMKRKRHQTPHKSWPTGPRRRMSRRACSPNNRPAGTGRQDHNPARASCGAHFFSLCGLAIVIPGMQLCRGDNSHCIPVFILIGCFSRHSIGNLCWELLQGPSLPDTLSSSWVSIMIFQPASLTWSQEC